MSDLCPTVLIYQLDSYRREVQGIVVAVDKELRQIALDRTIFYPGGGGQPSDTGYLTGPDSEVRWDVQTAHKLGAVVWHRLMGIGELPAVGTEVHGAINWEDRYQLMRTHTALHVLFGVVFRDYGALVTGGNMGVERARMDFEMESADFTPERVATIERRANEEIALARDVRVQILPREAAFQIPDLIRTKINLLPAGITEVRTVEIVGLDLQADGGTHVANTREVGGLREIGTRSKGKANKRLEIMLEGNPRL